MDTTYWQDAKGRVYKVTDDATSLDVDGLMRIPRATYRKVLRERKYTPAHDSHAQGESADESEDA